MIRFGINTFGLSRVLLEDFNGTLGKLKEYGYEAIEPMVVFMENEDSEEGRAEYLRNEKLGMTGGCWPLGMAGKKFGKLRAQGMVIRSVHMFGPGWREPFLDKAIAFAKEQGFQYFVVSLNESSIDVVKGYLDELKYAVKKFKENGLELLLHNHETEWTECDGNSVFEFLLEEVPEVRVELDLGWCKFMKRDCLEIMKKYRSRIRILHFKDIREDASVEIRDNCMTAVGEGSLPLAEIMEEAENLDLDEFGYVIDQDNSVGDILRDAKVSVENVKKGSDFVPQPGFTGKKPVTFSLMSSGMVRDFKEGKMDFEDVCRIASQNQIRYMDLMEPEVDIYGIDKVKEGLNKYGLKVSCVLSFISMITEEEKEIKRRVRKALEMTSALSCGLLMIVPMLENETEKNAKISREDKVSLTEKYLRQAAEEAAAYGIKICIESIPTCELPLSSYEECLYLLERIPGLGLVYDTANMIPAGEDTEAYYEKLKKYICHVHVKDVRYTDGGLDKCRDGRYLACCKWGEGIIPLKSVMERLKADHFQGVCAIEYVVPEEVGVYPNEYQLKTMLEYLCE